MAIDLEQSSADSSHPAIRSLTAAEFEQFRKLAYEKFGLDLRNGKEHLVAARLSKKLRQLQLRSFKDYYQHVVNDNTGEALISMP